MGRKESTTKATLITIFHCHQSVLNKVLRSNQINPKLFLEFLQSKDILKKRDEFYKLFKSEEVADTWWERFTDWYIANKEW